MNSNLSKLKVYYILLYIFIMNKANELNVQVNMFFFSNKFPLFQISF